MFSFNEYFFYYWLWKKIEKVTTKEALAEKVVTCLSQGDYDCVANYIDNEGIYFVDGKFVKKYIEEEELNIENNQTIEVVKGENETEYVDVKIDNQKIFRIHAVQNDNQEWKVKLNYIAYDNNFNISIPVGATLTVNGQKIDSSLAEKINSTKNVSYENRYELELELDSYKFDKVASGNYDITIETDGFETITAIIPSKHSNFNEDSNKNIYYNSSEKSYGVKLNLPTDKKNELQEYTKKYIADVFDKINAKESFSSLKNYYESISSNDEKYFEKYKNNDTSTKNEYKDFKTHDFNFLNIIQYDKNHIVIFVEYKITYLYIQSFNKNNPKYETKQNKKIIVLKENNKTYKIINGNTFKF